MTRRTGPYNHLFVCRASKGMTPDECIGPIAQVIERVKDIDMQ
jgi:hypothetical protein